MHFENQLKSAMRQLRKEGIQARLNIMECCRGCVTEEKLGLKEKDGIPADKLPVVWHYGGQGGRVQFDSNGVPFVEDRSWRWSPNQEYEPHTLFFNHDNSAATRAVEVFKEHGLNVEWDESEISCIKVHGPSKEEVDAAEAERKRANEEEMQRRRVEAQRRQVEALRRQADELEASLA